MPLLLTSHGVLGRIHRAAETRKLPRSTLLLATAAAAGLGMGKTHSHQRAPIALAAGGAVLSFMGMSAVGDGALGAGATLIGYKIGAKRAAAAAPRSPVAPPVARGPQKRRGMLRRG